MKLKANMSRYPPGGQVLAFYSNDPSSNPTEVHSI